MSKIYTVAIVGAGSIGAMKPDNIDGPRTRNILTHAHAVTKNNRLKLIGIVDTDLRKLGEACVKWKTDVSDHTGAFRPDIWVVASPTHTHYDILKEVINACPMLIICEKPCCNSLREIEAINKMSKSKDIPIVVNYNRKYSKAIRAARERILFHSGDIYSASIKYTRGLIRDGSHAIDICNWFFGTFLSGKILNRDGISDHRFDDLTYPVYLSYQWCKNVFLIPCDGRAYSVFDMEVNTESGRYVLSDHFNTIRFYPAEKEKVYGNFKSLSERPLKTVNANLKNSLVNLYENCINFFDKTDYLYSHINWAIGVQLVLSKLLRK